MKQSDDWREAAEREWINNIIPQPTVKYIKSVLLAKKIDHFLAPSATLCCKRCRSLTGEISDTATSSRRCGRASSTSGLGMRPSVWVLGWQLQAAGLKSCWTRQSSNSMYRKIDAGLVCVSQRESLFSWQTQLTGNKERKPLSSTVSQVCAYVCAHPLSWFFGEKTGHSLF